MNPNHHSTGVLWKTKLKEIPPNIKIITHYKQITILNVIFVIMLSWGRTTLWHDFRIKQNTWDSIFKCAGFKALMSATRPELVEKKI